MHSANPHFRSDIEGMRAIAILLVIGAHFAIPGFAAGFIGVDIFFVLSGFLITGILVREYQKNQRINLPRFYANRFRRLFPALATMLLVSSFVAAQILPDTQNLTQSKAAAMSAVWLSNIHFTFADVDYFAAETSSNAFLHTWSLGVEEQFYLLWPLIILTTMTLFARQQHSKPLWVALWLITGVSLLACLYLSSTQPLFAFYMMPTRAWQFAAGGMVWLLSQQQIANQMGARAAGMIALPLLLAAMLLIGPATTYPGLYALLPTLATCALLWAGSNTATTNYKLLSLPAMQWIGRLSYAWYLWHWPVLILGEHLLPIRGHWLHTLVALALSLLLALITHHTIENPIRFGRAKQISPRWQIGISLALMLLFSSQFLRWHNNTHETLNSGVYSLYAKSISDLPIIYRDGCDDWFNGDEIKPCRYGSETANKIVVLLGDSIGAQWFNTLTEIYHPDEWALVVLTKSSCPMVEEPFFYQRIGREYTECSIWRDKALIWISEQQPDAVFIGSAASQGFTDEQWINGSQKVLNKLSASARNVYLIEANPTLSFNGPECLMQHQQKKPEKCTQDAADNIGYAHVASLLHGLTQNYNNVHWIETASFVCPLGQCSALQGEQVVYRDSQHLTASFTASAAEHFAVQLMDND